MADTNKALLQEVEKGAQLKHTTPAHDASAPKIEEGMFVNITAKCKMMTCTDLYMQVCP
jgi:hypothetical protein